jgi:alanine racemase
MAKERGESVGVHVKVDVGMGRLGIMPEELIPFCRKIEKMPGIHVAGVVSHLPMAEDIVSGVTARQIEHFQEIIRQLQGEISSRLICHIANSAALLGSIDAHCNMVRPGISLYGCYPDGLPRENISARLHPAMSFSTRIIQVKEVPAGYGISYGHLYVTDRPSRIAVLPVGYDDGYLRRLSNRAEVLIHGRRAPVRGRICMNACMVDITDFDTDDDVKVGEEVVLMGSQQQETITPEEMAGWMETITYEVFCLFGSMNQRRYI